MKHRKMKYRGTVAVDIDGVLSDFDGAVCEAFGEENRHLYSLFLRYPEVDPKLISEWVSSPETYVDLAPIFGGLLFLRQAYLRGWYVLLVTSRGKEVREVTRHWLARYGASYHEIMFTKHKDESLIDYDNLNPSRKATIVVDDSTEVLASMPERFCVAWRQPWNAEHYPVMWYSVEEAKLLMIERAGGAVVGVWDKVGKNETQG